MKTTHINLIVEDDVSETVLRRLIRESRRDCEVGAVLGRTGYGYIKSRISKFNQAAVGSCYFALTDLDTKECAAALVREWLPEPRHANLLFRVAVREVESWLLADRSGFAAYVGISEKLVPAKPDNVSDPKSVLVALAKRSPYRRIREDLVPAKGTTAKQGPGYNSRLAEFVDEKWSVARAKARSESLERAAERLRQWKIG